MTLTQHLNEMKAEHQALVHSVQVAQKHIPGYVPPFAFDEDFDTWLAALDADILAGQMADDQSEWQTSIAMGYSMS